MSWHASAPGKRGGSAPVPPASGTRRKDAAGRPRRIATRRQLETDQRRATDAAASKTLNSSVVVTRHAARLRDLLIFHRRAQHHAVGQLVHHAALDFLPRRLALGETIAALLLQLRLAFGELRLRDQDIRGTFVQIDPNTVPCL